jgi:hypothetical protein
MIVTDLNDRERRRYAEALNHMAASFQEAAKALRQGDDDKLAINIAIAALGLKMFDELSRIVISAVQTNIPDQPPTSENDKSKES